MDLLSLINVFCTVCALSSTLIMSTLLFLNYRMIRIKNTLYLATFFSLMALHNLFFLLASLTPDPELATLIFKTTFLGPLGVLMLLFFAESLRRASPFTRETFIGTSLFMASFIDGMLFNPIIVRENNIWYTLQLRSPLGYVTLLGLYVFSSVFVIYVYYLMYKKALTHNKKWQTRSLLLASTLGFVGTILVLLIEIFFFPRLVLEFLVVALATIVVGIAYIKNPYVAYLLVQDIYKILVIQKTGLLCYSKSFYEAEKIDDYAIAGLIQAITAFGEEALGLRSEGLDVNVIAFGDKKIIMKKYYSIIGIIITNQVSDAIVNALKNFTEAFWEKFVIYVKKEGLVIEPKEADALLEKEFSLLLP